MDRDRDKTPDVESEGNRFHTEAAATSAGLDARRGLGDRGTIPASPRKTAVDLPSDFDQHLANRHYAA